MILLRGLLSEFSYLVAEVHTSSTVSEISHFLQLVLRATLRSHQVTSHCLKKVFRRKKKANDIVNNLKHFTQKRALFSQCQINF